MLSTYNWIYGIAEVSAAFLGIVAAIIAISMFRKSGEHKYLRSWMFLIPGLLLFSLEEILGSLKTFGIFSTPHLTHIVPSFILIFLIVALMAQLNIIRGWFE